MKEHEVIVGEFENELSAELARSELISAGINADINKHDSDLYLSLLKQSGGVQLIVSDAQFEKAKKILESKFT